MFLMFHATPLLASRTADDRAAFARLKALDAQLRASDSATLVLQSLCERHGWANPARIHAERQDVAAVLPTDAQRRRLAISADEPVAYRRVKLMCGDHVLSEAENWYVPGRLSAAINAMLASGDTPFGAAIRPLKPVRRHLGSQWLWRGAKGGDVPQALLKHLALVLDGAGRPLAEVAETYQRDVVTP